MNVLELYREDGFDPRRAGGEWQGPCPACGGNDRFCVRENANHKEGGARGWYHCGHGKGGNGCGKSGDNIQYLRDFRDMGYKEACDRLGLTPADMQSDAYKYRSPRMPRKRQEGQPHTPKSWEHPEKVLSVSTWREHGMKFVDACHEALLQRPKSLDWLAGRGIPLEAVRRHKLGLHLGETSRGEAWAPSFRPWKSWGLRDETKDGRPRMFVLPAGIVVPWLPGGKELHRIRIRLAKPDQKDPKKRYHLVLGSSIDLFYAGALGLKAPAYVLVETELDAIMIANEAGDLVTAIGLGTSSAKPDAVVAGPLRRAVRVLNALDYDKAGAEATAWWQAEYPNSRRHPAPRPAKDAGEAWQNGVDIRTWILAGLPPSLHREPQPGPADRIKVQRAAQEASVPAGEVAEVLALLRASGGNIVIGDGGHDLGVNVDDEWRAANMAQADRLSSLVFCGVEAGDYLATLPDGIYTARNLVRRAG